MRTQKSLRLLIAAVGAIVVIGVLIYWGISNGSESNSEDEAALTPTTTLVVEEALPEEPADAALTIDAGTVVAPMNDLIRGTNIGLWTISEFYPEERLNERYLNLVKEAGIKLIRFPAGHEADTIYWDRTNSYKWYEAPPDSDFVKTLTPPMLDSYMSFMKKIDAEAMVTVNARINDSAMAADLVRYANIEKGYNIKYWEIGNEPEYYSGKHKVTAAQFADRIKEYTEAMKAVDPTIKIVGPAVGGISHLFPNMITPIMKKLKEDGSPVDAISLHWYPLAMGADPTSKHAISIDNLLVYSGSGYSYAYMEYAEYLAKRNHQKNLAYYRDTYAPGALIGLTEVGQVTGDGEGVADAHAGAIWLADILGRLAYNGIDYVTQFLLQGNQTYSLFNVAKEIRPAYYVYPLLTRYFGDQMVETKSSDNQNFTIWASKRTGVDDKLYLMVINKHQTDDLTASIELTNFAPQATALTWEFNAPSIDALYGANINGVEVAEDGSLGEIPGRVIADVSEHFTRTYPAHSVTMIELTTKSNQKDTVRYYGHSAVGISEVKSAADLDKDIANTPEQFAELQSKTSGAWIVDFPSTGSYKLNVHASGDGKASFQVKVDGQLIGEAVKIDNNKWNDYEVELGTVTSGKHVIEIYNHNKQKRKKVSIAHVDVEGARPHAVQLSLPADGAELEADLASVQLSWTPEDASEANEGSYVVIVADNKELVSPVISAMVEGMSYEAANLSNGTTYYWTVFKVNSHGSAASNAVFSFKTGGEPPVELKEEDDTAVGEAEPPSLIAHWKLDETSGTTASDSVGSYDGTVNGPEWTTGAIDQALSFEGAGHVVEITNADAFNFSEKQSFTISAWIDVPEVPTSWTGIITKGRDDQSWYGLWINPDKKWTFGAKNSNGENVFGGEATTGWQHVALVQNAATKERIVYVNGVSSGVGEAAGATNKGDIWLGGAKSVEEYFKGKLDDVRFYKGVLSESEIVELYEAKG